jgi:signal transduction histidine kinase
VISAQDAERARSSRELHDSTAQTLAAAKLQLQATAHATEDPVVIERLTTLRELVSDALEETRSLSHLLYPRVLDDLGLVAAVEWLARHARESGALAVEVETDVRGEIPQTVASVLYRVAQEGLRNAMTHAQATTLTLRVESDDDQATMEVADDGRGFDVAEAEARRPGMGLFAVRERVALVDGEVEIYSVPGRGTRLSATVPLRERPERTNGD